uniref:Myo-inositol-1-phosphate synthase n=1 Tax=Thermofilum pendens TaxID=2269 RepID=A0A7J3X4Z4_THEPE
MIRVAILGQGYAATVFAWGLARLKKGLVEPWGVPLAQVDFGIPVERLEVVASFDVDASKVGRTLYEIARSYGLEPEPELREVVVSPGLKLRSTPSFIKTAALDDDRPLGDALGKLRELLDDVEPDVVIDVTTTARSKPLLTWEEVERGVAEGSLPHPQVYAYLVLERRGVAYVNAQPAYVACSPAFVERAARVGSLVLGDDGATGATPLTVDIAEHLAERNRRVLSIAQFNIGGNADFLSLTEPERNLAKEETKSSFLEDVLGYEPPHFIRPSGYLEPLGDKKFVAMHIQWLSFGGFVDELVVNMRINDSPALAGLLVDLARLAYASLKAGVYGTVPEANLFYMKRPGPLGTKQKARVLAYRDLLSFVERLRGLCASCR